MISTNRKILLFAFFVFVVLILAYSNHFNNGFHFDDMHAIVNNVSIRTLSNIPQFFTDPRMFSSDPSHWGLRSLVTTTLAIDYAFGGLDPFYFQLSTFIWHIALCILIFFIYRIILNRSNYNSLQAGWIAVIAASWFALHKANAETINYIISRSDVLSTFMIALSFLLFIAYPQKRKYCFYIIPAFIGVFAKETMPMLVIILFFYITLFEKRLSVTDLFKFKSLKLIGNAIWQMLPLIVVVVITQVYTLSRIAGIPGISNPAGLYILTQTYVWLHYCIEFFLPMNLSADSDWAVLKNVFDERVIVGLIFVTGLFIAIFKTSAKEETRPVAFGLIWFSAALLPTSLAPFAEVTNDHRMYFPFVGLAFSVVTYVAILLKRFKINSTGKFWPGLTAAVVFSILSLNTFGAYQRNKVWKNEESLWYDVTVKSPLNGRGMMNYALAEMNKGDYVTAGIYFDKARVMLPYYSTLYINMGVLNDHLNNLPLADQYFKTAIKYGPDDVDPYSFYAWYLKEHFRYEEARQMAEKALAINPRSALSLSILLDVYNNLSMWPQLQQTAKTLLAILPGDKDAAAGLQLAEKNLIAVKNGLPVVKRSLSPADYLNISLSYYNGGDFSKCIDACNKALALQPDYAAAYNNIGAAYNKLKQWDKSAEACRKALKLDPGNKLAAGNLKLAEAHTQLP